MRLSRTSTSSSRSFSLASSSSWKPPAYCDACGRKTDLRIIRRKRLSGVCFTSEECDECRIKNYNLFPVPNLFIKPARKIEADGDCLPFPCRYLAVSRYLASLYNGRWHGDAKVGIFRQVAVANIRSVNDFDVYVSSPDVTRWYEKFRVKLNGYYLCHLEELRMGKMKYYPGCYCVVEDDDLTFERAVIKAKLERGLFQVECIDVSKRLAVKTEKLFVLEKRFRMMPRRLMPARLRALEISDRFAKETAGFLLEFAEHLETHCALILGFDTSKGRLIVDFGFVAWLKKRIRILRLTDIMQKSGVTLRDEFQQRSKELAEAATKQMISEVHSRSRIE